MGIAASMLGCTQVRPGVTTQFGAVIQNASQSPRTVISVAADILQELGYFLRDAEDIRKRTQSFSLLSFLMFSVMRRV